MSKRKKTSAEDAVPAAVESDRTSPDLAGPSDETVQDFGPEPDTQVGPAPTEPGDDSWDGPTNAGTQTELAELAAASVSDGGGAEAAPEGVVEGEATTAEAAPDAGAPPEGASPDDASAGAGDVAPEPPPDAGPGRLASIVESLLFASDRPLTLAELKRHVGERDGAKITAALEDLRARRAETGVQVVQVAGGWHLRTNPENVAWVSRILSGKPPRLSRAMLETLAIVAYRQPITRPEIDEIRGVDCGPVLKTLLERNLVRMIGKKEEVGRPILYGTTPEFLRTFSLRDLTELPTLREFHELGEAERAKVEAAKVDAGAPGPDAAAPPPPKPVLRELDPEEEDDLLAELDQANAAAAQATAPPPEATPAADAGADDKTAG